MNQVTKEAGKLFFLLWGGQYLDAIHTGVPLGRGCTNTQVLGRCNCFPDTAAKFAGWLGNNMV